MLADGDGGSRRGLVASGQWSYLAPVWRKNCFWLGWEQPAIARGLDAVETLWEPIRKAIDQSPLISQWRAHPNSNLKLSSLVWLTDDWPASWVVNLHRNESMEQFMNSIRLFLTHVQQFNMSFLKKKISLPKLKMTHQHNETMGCFHLSTC